MINEHVTWIQIKPNETPLIHGSGTRVIPSINHTPIHHNLTRQEGMGPLRGALNEYWVQQLSKKLLATMGTYER